MGRKVIYWVSTGLLAAVSVFAAFTYLSGSPQAVEGFAHVGYPQQLRIILGMAKLLGAIALVAPGAQVSLLPNYRRPELEIVALYPNCQHLTTNMRVFL